MHYRLKNTCFARGMIRVFGADNWTVSTLLNLSEERQWRLLSGTQHIPSGKVHLKVQAYYHIPVDSINSTFYTSGDIRNTHINVKPPLFNQATKNQQVIKKNAIGHKIRTLLPLTYFSNHFPLRYIIWRFINKIRAESTRLKFSSLSKKMKLFYNFCVRFSSTSFLNEIHPVALVLLHAVRRTEWHTESKVNSAGKRA
jgi:hypothetical protein